MAASWRSEARRRKARMRGEYRLAWNQRQNNVRRAGGVVENSLGRTLEVLFFEQWPAGIQVTIIVGKIAARDFHPDSMPRLDHMTGCPQIDRVFVHFVRCDTS